MVSYASLTDHAAVESAFEEFDKLGRELFHLKYGFKETNDGFVLFGVGRYDVRPIFAAAYWNQHGEELTMRQVAGGVSGAAGQLVALGYVVFSAGDQAGARRFSSLDEALAAFRMPVENLPVVRDFVAVRLYREFYIPESGAYIGAKPRSGKPAHLIGRGYISYREEDGRVRGLTLPQRVSTPPAPLLPIRETRAPREPRVSATRAAVRPAVERVEKFCPECFLVLPATGVCANCG